LTESARSISAGNIQATALKVTQLAGVSGFAYTRFWLFRSVETADSNYKLPAARNQRLMKSSEIRSGDYGV
jgi:hypothetical protein